MAVHVPQRPSGRPVVSMRWLNLLFIHWPVSEDLLRPLIPKPLEIDTFDGVAWVGLIPFTMNPFRVTHLPPVPTMHRFHECNVRTYVRHKDEAGVWFFSLDAASRLAVWGARRLWNLNYFYSRMSLSRENDTVQYSVERHNDANATMRCTWQVGNPLPQSQPGGIAHFLTERYRLFSVDGAGQLFRARIWHQPWPLRNARLLSLEDGLVNAAGIAIRDDAPLLHHADELDVRAWPLERVQ